MQRKNPVTSQIKLSPYEDQLLKVYYFSETESKEVTPERSKAFLEMIANFEKLPTQAERHYLQALLFEKCPNTFLNAYPKKSEQNWLEEVLVNFINAHRVKDSEPELKKLALAALSKLVHQIGLTITLPLSEIDKSYLVKMFEEQRIAKMVTQSSSTKHSEYPNLFKNSLTAVSALSGLCLSGGWGLLGGVALGYLSGEAIESCRKSKP
jgi:hypothetical protein